MMFSHRPNRWTRVAAAVLIAGGATLVSTQAAVADGTEGLGPPSVTVVDADGVAIGGAGLFTQPAMLSVTVPDDATVVQALLYFEAGHREGDRSGAAADDTITVDGVDVTGTLIGGPTPFYGPVITQTYRADITDLGLVGPGTTTLRVEGLDDDEVDDGAALLVLYEQPGVDATIAVRDGNDIAFVDFEAPRDTTVPQEFTFSASDAERTATLALAAASVHDPDPRTGSRHRPHAVLVTVDGVTTRYDDVFDDHEGPEMDTVALPVTVPAGATSVAVQIVSEWDDSGDLPASLVWLTVALAVPESEAAALPTTITAPQETPTTAPPATVEPPKPAVASELAFTGDHTGTVVAIGVGAMLAGFALLVLSRETARRA